MNTPSASPPSPLPPLLVPPGHSRFPHTPLLTLVNRSQDRPPPFPPPPPRSHGRPPRGTPHPLPLQLSPPVFDTECIRRITRVRPVMHCSLSLDCYSAKPPNEQPHRKRCLRVKAVFAGGARSPVNTAFAAKAAIAVAALMAAVVLVVTGEDRFSAATALNLPPAVGPSHFPPLQHCCAG